jgi:hypothetical protein
LVAEVVEEQAELVVVVVEQAVARVAHLDEDLVAVPVAQWAQQVLVGVAPEWPVGVGAQVGVGVEVSLKLVLPVVEVEVVADSSPAQEAAAGQLTTRDVVVKAAAAAILPAAVRATQAAQAGEDGVPVGDRHRLVRVAPAAKPSIPMATQ